MNQGELQPNVSPFDALKAYPARFWFAILVTGLGAGIAGGLLMKLLYAVQDTIWSDSGVSFLEGVEASSFCWRVLVLFSAGLVIGMGRWLLQYNTGGHGGEIAKAIWFHSGRLPIFWASARAVLSIIVVGMGASVGREGALKQAGAVVAFWMSSRQRLSVSQRRLLVACGAGAGAAVAYNVPLGGALFALEVLLGELSLPLVVPALTASLVATATSWILLPNRPTYSVPSYEVTLPLLLWALICGPLFGMASVAYIRLIGLADARKPSGSRILIAPVLVLTLLGLLAIPLPELLGNGKDLVQLAFVGELSLFLLAILPALKVLSTAACLGSGTPGGLFTPTLAFGALLGGLLGECCHAFWPGTPLGSFSLVGATATLAAATQGPLSSIAMVIELTHRLDPVMIPTLICIVPAVLVARRLDAGSLYTARIHLARVALAALPAPSCKTAFDDWISHDYEVISTAAHYAEVIPRVLAHLATLSPLYVVNEDGRLLGEINPRLVSDNESITVPVEMATAGDLVSSVPVLTSRMAREDVERIVRGARQNCLPVIVASSQHLVGVVCLASWPQ